MNIRVKHQRRWAVAAIALFWLGVAGLSLALSGSLPLLRFDSAARAPGNAGDGNVRGRAASASIRAPAVQNDPMTTRDATGWLRSYRREGAIDTSEAFFQSLGTNGRSCNTCHRQEAAWSITPTRIRARFDASDGLEPLFRRNDGSNSPLADISTLDARRQAFSMLLNHGVLRIGMPVPPDAEFTLDAADDPYGYASAAELSLFRRPLPGANLAFLTAVMWDGRETTAPFLPPMHAGQDNTVLQTSLIQQALHATLGHAQAATPPTNEQLAEIVAFETSVTSAQIRDDAAGFLNADDALGGPRILASQRFHIGINDTFGADPTGALFDPAAMGLFAAWRGDTSPHTHARRAIVRGERLFNEFPIAIAGVAGLNDVLGQPVIMGTCSSCHNTPNVGNHSVAAPLNIGISDASRRTPDMPLYTLRNKTTGDTVQTTDPGLALITGKWADIGKFKGPILRGLAARPPYFHNGSAATLHDAVDFYDTRFQLDLSPQQKQDLVAFLRAL